MLRQIITLCVLIPFCKSARILAVFPTPFISHQLVFRPLTQELARRGHEVVVITTDPVFKDKPFDNLTEIDIHDISYDFRETIPSTFNGEIYEQIEQFLDMSQELFDIQMKTNELKNLINDKKQHFDLLIIEACFKSALVFSRIYKAPVITISSLGSLEVFAQNPKPKCTDSNNMRIWESFKCYILEKAAFVYQRYYLITSIIDKMGKEDENLKLKFGSDAPTLEELENNVVLQMINVHHIWEDNRPVPPQVLYLGGLHLNTKEFNNMTVDLKSYLDSSVNGVIYISLGSIVKPSRLLSMKVVLQAISKLPYNVVLKWDESTLPGCPSNVKLMRWLPQRQLLHHPNIKLFITQGGLQSTDEAIEAEVPLIGIPVLTDQWYNVEKYVQFKIGHRIYLESVTENEVIDTINTVINDTSYKRNIRALHQALYDKPQRSLEQAVWWTEYILKHGSTGQNQVSSVELIHNNAWVLLEMALIMMLIMICILFLLKILVSGLKLCSAICYDKDKVKCQ